MINHDGYSTLIDQPRLLKLQELAIKCLDLTGKVIEIGVYKGGSLTRLASIFSKKRIFGVDTFEGMPPPCEFDLHKEGDFKDVNFDLIKEWFAEHNPNVTLIKGLFPDDIMPLLQGEKFCFAHIDCDIYESVKACCECIWPKMVSQGIMVFDDYGFSTTPGAKKAINDFFMNMEDCSFCQPLDTGQFVAIKKVKGA